MKTFHSILEDAKFSDYRSLKRFRAKSNDSEDLWFSVQDGGDNRLGIDVSMNCGNQVLGFQWHYKTKVRNFIFVISNYDELSLSLKREISFKLN